MQQDKARIEGSEASFGVLTFSLIQQKDTVCTVQVVVPQPLVAALFHEIAQAQQAFVVAPGFARGNIPLLYVKTEFRSAIIEYLKEFLLKYSVFNFLFEQLRVQKIIVVGDPVLDTIILEPERNAIFTFEVPIFSGIHVQEWKLLPFKMPKRKNYRDIDRQVESFINTEQAISLTEEIEWGDWVHLKIELVNANGESFLSSYSQNFWFCMRDEEVENKLHSALIGRFVGDRFLFREPVGLYDLCATHLDGSLPLMITILHRVSYRFFCFERFKKHFRIKSQKDIHKKLIEVFSFRNDLSQRSCIVDEAFRLLLSKHRFSPPIKLVQTLESIILHDIKKKLDYSVYKREKNFDQYVRQLAEKQAREVLLADAFSYHEGLEVSDEDVCNYLGLTGRPRTGQLLHFQLPSSKRGGMEIPMSSEHVKQVCLREKTINFIIYNLTR
jgi:FKBP-type peptidyl-prolyl cis-trans isomerase (trigger factor)